MDISVIIPTLNEAATIGETLRRVRSSGRCEVIVVDGGSDDGTPELARPQADLVLSAGRGRARQMNVGARAASGQVLLFLHADTVLPPDFPALLENALRNPRVVGGRFDVRLDAEGRVKFTIGGYSDGLGYTNEQLDDALRPSPQLLLQQSPARPAWEAESERAEAAAPGRLLLHRRRRALVP